MRKKKLYKVIILVLIISVFVFANTAGPLGGTGAGASWTNPTNIAATDGVYATSTVIASSDSFRLSSSTFGFSIPAGATINGIQVAIVRHASVASVIDFGDVLVLGNLGVSLTKVAATPVGTAKLDTTTWGVTDGTTSLGSVADLWGTTWSPTDINSTGFGVVIQCENQDVTNRTASIDSILVTVTFTPAASTSQTQMFKVF